MEIMKRILSTLAVAASLTTVACLPDSASADTRGSSSFQCSSISVAAPAGTKIESLTSVSQAGGTVTVPAVPPLPASEVKDVPAYCDVTITLTL
jgi:feruloyl esterase